MDKPDGAITLLILAMVRVWVLNAHVVVEYQCTGLEVNAMLF